MLVHTYSLCISGRFIILYAGFGVKLVSTLMYVVLVYCLNIALKRYNCHASYLRCPLWSLNENKLVVLPNVRCFDHSDDMCVFIDDECSMHGK